MEVDSIMQVLSSGDISHYSDSVESAEDPRSLLDRFLKALVEEELGIYTKLCICQFIERESSLLFYDSADVELAFAVFNNMLNSSCGNSQLLQGQLLVSITTILIETFEKLSGKELNSLFSQHMNTLFILINQNNNASNIYVRSVAASCLVELEVCFPLLLKYHLENIYLTTIAETSVAHHQYTALLALVARHCMTKLGSEKLLWNASPEIDFIDKYKGLENAVEQSFPNNKQLVSFLIDQLYYSTSEGTVWVVHNIISVLSHCMELRASAQILKSLLFKYIYSCNASVFHHVMWFEELFGEQMFQDKEYRLLLDQLLLNSTHPSLSPFIHLIYLDILYNFLTRHKHYTNFINGFAVLLPTCFHIPEIQIKIFMIFKTIFNSKKGGSNFLLKMITNTKKQLKDRKSFKVKSVFMKCLFWFLHKPKEISSEEISRIILAAVTKDVTVVPFVLHLIRQIQLLQPHSTLPSYILDNLLTVHIQTEITLTSFLLNFILDIFQESITQGCSTDSVKSILSFIHNHVLKSDVPGLLNWKLGSKTLKLCFWLMKEYNVNTIFYELNVVLNALALKNNYDSCNDTQDQAQTYQNLLKSFSNKKLKTILQGPKQAIPRIFADESNFHSKASVQTFDTCILQLNKIKQITFLKTIEQLDVNVPDVLEKYTQLLLSDETFRKFAIKVYLEISSEFKDVLTLEALALFINVPEDWGFIDHVMVGHFSESLCLENKCRVFDVMCHPRYPCPVTASIRAEFSIDNVCHVGPVKNLCIEFSDFFTTLPALGDAKILYDALWKNLEKHYKSVLILQCSEELVRKNIKDKLNPYIISVEGDTLYHVGIYLPPSNHLLMNFEIQGSQNRVKFVTDYIHVLSFTTKFFSNWL